VERRNEEEQRKGEKEERKKKARALPVWRQQSAYRKPTGSLSAYRKPTEPTRPR